MIYTSTSSKNFRTCPIFHNILSDNTVLSWPKCFMGSSVCGNSKTVVWANPGEHTISRAAGFIGTVSAVGESVTNLPALDADAVSASEFVIHTGWKLTVDHLNHQTILDPLFEPHHYTTRSLTYHPTTGLFNLTSSDHFY